MEAMARASLDQNFKDELSAIEQWFQVLSEAERTATLYSLLQHTTRVQQGFFVAFLQQLIRRENANAARNAGADKNKNRNRRVPGKPQLTITGTNEKYARMFGEESSSDYMSPTRANANAPMTAQPFKETTTRTPSIYNARPKTAQLGAFPQPQQQRWSHTGLSPAVRTGGLDSATYGDLSSAMNRLNGESQELDAATAAAAAAASGKWQPLTPTFSTFSEMAKTIERPRSAAEADRPGVTPSMQNGGVATNQNAVNGKNWPQNAKYGQVFASRAPLGPPPAGGEQDRNFFIRPPGSARTPTGKFIHREPLTADPIRNMNLRSAASPALPPGLFSGATPTTPASVTMHHWDPNPKKSTMLRDFSAGLLSDGRLMDTKVNSKEAAAISRMLSNKNAKLGMKDAKKRATTGEGTTETTEKSSKPQEPIDFALLEDIAAWFRSMRLHKYTPLFETMTWRELVKLDDQQLSDKGVAALGARRKMLKVFEAVIAEAESKGIQI
jgi:hypothetical protein